MEYICSDCKYIGRPAKKKRGSKNMEFVAWSTFPLGVPYIIWRMFGKKDVCKQCGSDMIIQLNSRLGQTMAEAAGFGMIMQEISEKKNPEEDEEIKPKEDIKKTLPQNPESW